jgi:murein DD-endopeptidase MepM/ murein hydrolase activator NlpD
VRKRVWVVAVVTLFFSVATATAASAAGSVDAKIAAAKKAANAAAARLDGATRELAKAEEDVAKFRAQSATNQKKIDELQQRLRTFALREYKTGQHARFTALDDPSELARSRYLAQSVVLGSVDDLDAYRVLKADEAQTQNALDARLRDRLAAVTKLKAQRAGLVAQLNSLGKAMKAQKNGARVLAHGAWVCPVQGARAFSNDWGQPRSGGRRHKGTDVFAPYGTPVVAPVGGLVADHDSGLGGKGFWLRGSDGNTYYGAHLSRFGAVGPVSQGQVVGYVGTSGNARGGPAHLHFEIHPGGGAAVNPYGTLRAYC